MFSVVITEVMQFIILTITSLIIGIIAMYKVAPEMIEHRFPPDGMNPFFGWHARPRLDRHPRHRSTAIARTATSSSASSSA